MKTACRQQPCEAIRLGLRAMLAGQSRAQKPVEVSCDRFGSLAFS